MPTKILGLGSKVSLSKKGITGNRQTLVISGEVTTITKNGLGIQSKDGTLSCITLADADKLIDSGDLVVSQV